MNSLREMFVDDRGQLSSGRIFAGYCVVCSLLCWLAGVWSPPLAAHAQNGMNSMLTAAVTFYGAGKAVERFGKQDGGQ